MHESESDQRHEILILGASTRGAAQSAIRAGLRPICGDLFADFDLRACALVLDVPDYPRGLAIAAGGASQSPWMYTGGLENHPALVDRISETRPLWGNGGDVLRRVRDPWWVQQVLRDAGLLALDVWPKGADLPPADGSWMLKPLRSAAGRDIRLWDGRAHGCAALRVHHYFQE